MKCCSGASRPASQSRSDCTLTTRAELAGVAVELEFDRVHADDCEDCDERADGFIDRIQSKITLHGSFDDAQRKRLTQVAQRCPVHKTLANGVHISDSVEFSVV